MTASGRRPVRARLPIALLLLAPGPALATAFNYEMGLGLRHDDNVGLDETDEESDTILQGNLRFTARKDTPNVDLRARGNLRYLNYLGGTFDDEMRGEVSGAVDWTIMPNRLHWVAEDYLSQQAVDILGSPDPSNQQQVNIFITGPSLLFRLGRHNVGQMDLRYMDTYAEETQSFNGNRLVAKASILRELNPTTVASFNLEGSQSEFDENAESNDYKRWDAYFTFQRRLPALRLKADIGYTEIKPEGIGVTDDSSPLLRASVDWTPRGRHTLTGRVDYQIADAAQYLIRRSSELANETYASTVTASELLDNYDTLANSSLVIGAEAYRERRVDVGYRYDGDRFTLRFHPFVHRVRYLEELTATPDLDRNSNGSGVSVDYKLRPTLALTFNAYNENIEYPTLDRDDHQWGATVALTDRSARNWRWRLEVGHGRRDSSVPGESYKDNVVAFFITRTR